jgi:hypothetical protein
MCGMSEQNRLEVIGLFWLIALVVSVPRLALRLWLRGRLARYTRPARHRIGSPARAALAETGWYPLPYGGRALHYSPLSASVRRFLAPSAYVTGYALPAREWIPRGVVTPASLGIIGTLVAA